MVRPKPIRITDLQRLFRHHGQRLRPGITAGHRANPHHQRMRPGNIAGKGKQDRGRGVGQGHQHILGATGIAHGKAGDGQAGQGEDAGPTAEKAAVQRDQRLAGEGHPGRRWRLGQGFLRPERPPGKHDRSQQHQPRHHGSKDVGRRGVEQRRARHPAGQRDSRQHLERQPLRPGDQLAPGNAGGDLAGKQRHGGGDIGQLGIKPGGDQGRQSDETAAAGQGILRPGPQPGPGQQGQHGRIRKAHHIRPPLSGMRPPPAAVRPPGGATRSPDCAELARFSMFFRRSLLGAVMNCG